MAINLFNKVENVGSDIRRTIGEFNTELAPINDALQRVNSGINAFKDVSAQIGQLKSNLSISQKLQLTSLSGLSGLSSGANKIAGNITNTLSSIDNTSSSIINVSGTLASSLENSGMAVNTIRDVVSKNVSSAIVNKTPFHEASSATPSDLGKIANRLPKAARTNPVKKIQDTKDTVLGFTDSNAGGLSFPKDLGEGNAKTWIKLNIEKYDRSNPFVQGSLDPIGRIFLPLPKSLVELFSVNYESKDFGIATGGILKAGGDESRAMLGDLSNIIDKARQGEADASALSLGSRVSDMANSITAQEGRNIAFASLQNIATTALSGVGQEGLAGLADRIVGGVPNPHSTVFFKGINLRTFTWNWYLVPRSKADSQSLRSIVNALKKATLPSIDGSILTYPNFVTPSIKGENAIDMKFKRCMVGDLGIDYTPDAQAFHEDGAPVSCNLSITFKEIEIFTQEDVEN
jgi:hypothetical protein